MLQKDRDATRRYSTLGSVGNTSQLPHETQTDNCVSGILTNVHRVVCNGVQPPVRGVRYRAVYCWSVESPLLGRTLIILRFEMYL